MKPDSTAVPVPGDRIPAGWENQLNAAQLRAVCHGSGPLLIIAGAGTGKTRTLAYRVAWLVGQGVSAERILLLTFTRRAAQEMVTRAEALCREPTERVWGGTFHAVGNRLLRMYGRAIGLGPDFTVADEGDSADLLGYIRNELGYTSKDKRFPRKRTIRAIYSRVVNSRVPLGEVLEREYPWCAEVEKELKEIFRSYTERKKQRGVLDYDDLLIFWKHLLELDRVREQMAGMFEHVLVDEYQDTNIVQAEILEGLRRDNRNITVVGDDAQSIYMFRGATVRNILEFPEKFPAVTTVTLEDNYRSVQPILSVANRVMAGARVKFTKNLRSDRPSGQRPVLLTCVDEAEQCRMVCERVLKHLEEGIPLCRQAVLFRAGHHSDMLEIELARRNIPFHKYGGLRFVEAAHVKDLLALLRVLENPRDEVSWFRVLEMLDGVGPKAARRVVDFLRAGGDSGGGFATEIQSEPASVEGTDWTGESAPGGDERPPRRENLFERLRNCPVPRAAQEGFRELVETLSAIARDRDRLPVASQVERLRQYYEPLLTKLYDNPVPRGRDLEQLESIAGRYRSRSNFITDLTLDPPQSTADIAGPPHRDEDFLVLSTMHSAKGCEWQVVYVIHAADGMIPSDMATGDDEGVEEERRLFYVAVTRAEDRLYVLFPLRYYTRRNWRNDSHLYAQLTRFITPDVAGLFEQKVVRYGFAEEAAPDPAPDYDAADSVRRRIDEFWD